MRTPIVVGNFQEFLNQYQNKPIYYCDGFVPDVCLEYCVSSFITFVDGYSLKQLNADTKNGIENGLFEIEKTNSFYYPNTNMFSGDNSIYGIKGCILKLIK